ncbi:hypothetical protein ILUMI_04322 [Ignelater luminosus]|uniref:Peptidase M14 domain-containing protein n=1 Tax=Ignelater luminosus TaxID=2038154 RepID=A0A8K0DEK4_IGNLU|nr:hypothetical protein ILUMI_04322 [Ignelater luminosus]
MTNCEILNKLFVMVSCGGSKERFHEKVVHYISNYLRSHSQLLYQVIYIISDTEDLHTCTEAIKLLYELLIKNEVFREADRAGLKRVLGSPSIFGTFVESVYFIHMRFCYNNEYKAEYQNLQAKLLHMIVSVCRTKQNRQQLKCASDGTIGLIGKFMSMYHKHKLLGENLMEIVRTMCIKKRNSNIMASKKFIEGLCNCFRLTQKAATFILILRALSRNETALGFMNGNEKLFNVILELVSYSGKKPLNKPALLTTLFRITKTENSLKILSRDDMFYKLFYFFMKNDKYDESYRIGTIKAYSILNRSVSRVILPIESLDVDSDLPAHVRKCLEEERGLEDSDHEKDESEDDSQYDEDSDDNECTGESSQAIGSKRLSNDDQKTQDKEFEETLTHMIPYFSEYLPNAGNNSYCNSIKFDIFEGLDALPNVKIIENRVHRGRNMNKNAFPDAAMMEAESDDSILNPLVNNFSLDRLAGKIKCLKGVQENKYTPRVVYDLDYLYRNFQKPPDIPHPESFVSKNPELRSLTGANTVLKFESRFECGNLRKVVQIEKYEYELFLSPDTNTATGLQWFYFQVSNMICGMAYTFNIANFSKCSSQYNHGMQPLMFSVTEYTLNKIGWRRVGEEVIYYGNHYMNKSGDKQYKTLSFSISFQYSNDYVYFAYHYPYTYTRLMLKLFPLLHHKSNEIYTRLDKLCKTVNTRNEIALLTITGAWNRRDSLGIPFARRPLIFITARVHPGESNSSWIMEGMIKFLLDERNEDAIKAREHFIFKIIPMLNPEGVIYGNGRAGLTGTDLNRCWAKPHKITYPEIYNPKRLIACAKKELRLPIAAYIDIHGHSRKKFFFFYGCNPKMSWNKNDKSSGDLQDILKLLPETVQGINPNIRLPQCRYKIEKCRESTGRVVMWREFDIKHSYTLECSYSFGNNKQSVNTKILNDIGSSVIASLGKIADKAYVSKKVLESL